MRQRIELRFAAWGRWVHRHARATIGAVGLAMLALASQLPGIEFDTSTEAFLHEDDPVRITYDRFREQFGRDEMVLIAIRPPEVFDLGFLGELKSFHDDLENEVPKLQQVTSLVNARHTRGEADELIVEDLLQDWPETPQALALIRERALANPFYRDQLIDEHGRLTTVLIETDAYSSLEGEADELGGFEDEPATAHPRPFLTGEENSAIVEAISEVVSRYDAPDFRIYLAGSPVMVHRLQTATQRDMGRFTLLSLATIGALLALLFRRVAGVVLPLLVASLSLMATLALMAASGVAITLVQQILPSFLLAVGVGSSVHVLVIFFQARKRGESEREAIAFALGHSGLAIVMTSLTTAGGLASFTTAELAPIAQFGVTAPVGVMVSLVLTLVLLPALIAVFPMRGGGGDRTRDRLAQRALVRCGGFATAHAGSIVLASLGILAIAGLGAAMLRFSHDPMRWFPEDDFLRASSELMDAELKGTMFLEVLVDSGAENGLHRPELLNRMDALRRWASSVQRRDLFVGKTVSLVDVLKEIHRALNEDRREFYAIPQDRPLVAQELLLFENSGSDDLEDVVDSRFQVGRVTLKLPFVDSVQYAPFIWMIEENFARILGDEAEFTLTGLMAIMGRTFNAVMYTMAKSYILAFLVITPLMILLIGKFRIGLLSMIPNLAPILLTLGVMGWLGVSLDAFTLLIGSIAIGLAVDDTIHFMHNFRRYYERSGDVPEAVRETLTGAGQAMLFTTLALSAGFFVFSLATLTNLIRFGVLTGFTILMAFLADVILAPALMKLAVGRERVPSRRAPATEGIS